MPTVELKINDIPVSVEEGTSLLEAARSVQIRIPTLCHHPALMATGACGLCIVKIRGDSRLMRACTTPVRAGMEVITHDPEIVETRRSVLELTLSNHPNECLTCGRNRTCELQTAAQEFGIRRDRYPRTLCDLPKDASTGAIVLDPSKCIKCGRCVQVCQTMQNTWALAFLGRGFDSRMAPIGNIPLSQSPCVRCGQCSAHCPTGAILEHDDTDKVWAALRDPAKFCTVQIAPAVRVSLAETFGCEPGHNVTKKLYTLMRRLGFNAVFDTNFSADVTIVEEANEFAERFRSGKDLPIITSCCPAWMDFVGKNHPDFVANCSTTKSPQQIMGALVKTYYAETQHLAPESIVQVSIMPCTAKKLELKRSDDMRASGYSDVDVVLTTRELSRMVRQAGIDFLNLPDGESDSIMGNYSGAGTIFGVTGGVMEAALRTANFLLTGHNLSGEDVDIRPVRGSQHIREARVPVGDTIVPIAVVHGLAHVDTVLDRLRKAHENNEPPPYLFVEVMACPGGCIGGGGQPYSRDLQCRPKRIRGLYSDDTRQTIRLSHENPEIKRLYAEFLGEPNGSKAHHLLHSHFQPAQAYVWEKS
jgi:NADH-quinone oxidoreductase subunit G